MLFSMSKKNRSLRYHRLKDSDVIKIDIQCFVKGDVVLECVHLDLEPEREVMMFRIMLNTAFIRSNILMLNSENLDILWDSKVRVSKGLSRVDWVDNGDVAALWLLKQLSVLNDVKELSIMRSRASSYLLCIR
ncbi:hypothetical protein CsSME_00049438 [Camellia sinensis var. sinensis]